ncbi:unnamed protein product [Merluccius merluccius]
MAPVALGCQLILHPATQGPRNPLRDPITVAGASGTEGSEVWVSPPPEIRRARGAGPEGPGLAVRHFSHQPLSCWESCASDPWVVATLSQGYNLTKISNATQSVRNYPPSWRRVPLKE